MKSSFLLFVVVVSLVGSCSTPETLHQPPALSQEAVLQKGKYLVGILGCGDCHSPKVFTEFGPAQDESRLLSGHPQDLPLAAVDQNVMKDWVLFGFQNTVAVGPWGASFAANLTSDATGIGNWSYDQFKVAMTEGKFKGLKEARNLLPPMPWPNYRNMAEEDLQAIFAYLKSTKPVRNVVPAPVSPSEL